MINVDLGEKFKEISARLKAVSSSAQRLFSEESIKEFYRGFDLPILGCIAYLKSHTSFYEIIECNVTSDQINQVTIVDEASYRDLWAELLKISVPCGIDFNFSLTKGIFPFLKDIRVFFSVYFSLNNYTISYAYADGQHLNFEKQYLEHISPSQIENLRDQIADSILNVVSHQVDSNLKD